MPLRQGQLETRTQIRERFLGNLIALLGDTRLLWTPKLTDTTTSTDESLNASTLTADATMAGQIVPLGNGHTRSFNGSSNYLTTPSRTNLSFGNGTTDQAFSLLALANVTNTAAARQIMTKFTTANREWTFLVNASDQLQLTLIDDSASALPNRASNSAITQGASALFGATYSGAGGATAANGMILYQDGLSIASTATNSGSYVAMEQLGAACEIGSVVDHTANYMQGSMALCAVVAGALTASQMWAAYRLCRGYFNV